MSQESLSVGTLPEWQRRWFYAIGKRIRLRISGDHYTGVLRRVNATCSIVRVKFDDGRLTDVPVDMIDEWRVVTEGGRG